MRSITPALAALLRSRLQVAGSGYRGRIEVDSLVVPTTAPYSFATSSGWRGLLLSNTGGTVNAEPSGWRVSSFDASAWDAVDVPFIGAWHAITGAATVAPHPYTGGQLDGSTWIARGTFDLPDGAADDGTLTCNADDDMQVWLNDTEIVAAATAGVFGSESTFVLPEAAFVSGTNVLAVKVSNETHSSVFSTNPTMFQARLDVDVPATELGPIVYHPTHIGINRNLRMGPDQLDVELTNEDLALGYGPTSIFPTNSRIRAYRWYGDEENEVLSFTGVIDKVADNRDPLTTALTCRSLAGPILVDQTFSTTAPQTAGETGAVRTVANGVYLNTEVDAVVLDILERAGWPADSIDVSTTSFVLDEYIREDGASGWDDLTKLADIVGYTVWDDEDGVIHFGAVGTSAGVDEPLTADFEYEIGAAL